MFAGTAERKEVMIMTETNKKTDIVIIGCGVAG